MHIGICARIYSQARVNEIRSLPCINIILSFDAVAISLHFFFVMLTFYSLKANSKYYVTLYFLGPVEHT